MTGAISGSGRTAVCGGNTRRSRLSITSAIGVLSFACLAIGCGEEQESAYDRSEKALHDPMHYSPYSAAEKKAQTGATGDGGKDAAKDAAPPKDAAGSNDRKDDVGSFDKEGFRKDLQHVLDP